MPGWGGRRSFPASWWPRRSNPASGSRARAWASTLLRTVLGVWDVAEIRAALVASQVLGLALTRYALELDPIAAAGTDDLAAAIGPTIERYLTGDIR